MATIAQVLPIIAAQVLYPYQREWLGAMLRPGADTAILGGRQEGKDYTTALACAAALCTRGAHPEEWQVVSATRDHAAQFVRDVKDHLGRLAPLIGWDGRFAVENTSHLTTPWGSSLHSHAASVRSIVGHRGSFVLNEVSAIPGVEEIFQAAYPVATGARANGRPGRFVLIGNASDMGTWWQQSWDGGLETFDRITTPFSGALRSRGWTDEQIEREKRAIISNIGTEAYEQWYECQWRTSLGGLFAQATLNRQRCDVAALAGWRSWPQVVGMDVGRTGDPSAVTRLLVAPTGQLYALPTLTWHQVSYADQLARLEAVCRERPTLGVVIDQTGNIAFLEQAQAHLAPLTAVAGYTFTAVSKWGLFDTMRQVLDAGDLWLPPDDLDLRMDLDGVKAVDSFGGIPRVELPRDRRGHSDRAVALGLALHGARQGLGIVHTMAPEVGAAAAAERRRRRGHTL